MAGISVLLRLLMSIHPLLAIRSVLAPATQYSRDGTHTWQSAADQRQRTEGLNCFIGG